jgi:hypothetical protein
MDVQIGDVKAFASPQDLNKFLVALRPEVRVAVNWQNLTLTYLGTSSVIERKEMTEDVQSTLSTRQNSHGDFRENGRIMQQLKIAARTGHNWKTMEHHKQEAIDMILHKIGRILSGNSDHADHWHDIAGYATLCENIILTGEPYQTKEVAKDAQVKK